MSELVKNVANDFAELPANAFEKLPEDEKNNEFIAMKSRSYFQDVWFQYKKNKMAMVSLIFIIIMILMAIFMPMFSRYSYDAQDLTNPNMMPSALHWFGTDKFGRDIFIRVMYGARISLSVGFAAAAINLVIGIIWGGMCGYIGGRFDMILMRIVDIIYSLPDMLMVILLATVFNQLFKDPKLAGLIEGTFFEKIGGNIISLFIVFALLYWVSMSRLIRGQILSLREQEYVLAAKATGAGSRWTIVKHLIPNCISVIIISTALQIPSAIFTESYLSFLGLGVNAPMPSLGSLASDALNGISAYPERLIIPAAVISLIVLSLNLFGDGLRDAFDPKINS